MEKIMQNGSRVFTYRLAWKLGAILAGVPLVGIYIAFGYLLLQDPTSVSGTFGFLVLVGLVGAVVAFTIGILQILRGRIELTQVSLTYRNWWRTVKINRDQIKSTQSHNGYLCLRMKPDTDPKNINILKNLGANIDILLWID